MTKRHVWVAATTNSRHAAPRLLSKSALQQRQGCRDSLVALGRAQTQCDETAKTPLRLKGTFHAGRSLGFAGAFDMRKNLGKLQKKINPPKKRELRLHFFHLPTQTTRILPPRTTKPKNRPCLDRTGPPNGAPEGGASSSHEVTNSSTMATTPGASADRGRSAGREDSACGVPLFD